MKPRQLKSKSSHSADCCASGLLPKARIGDLLDTLREKSMKLTEPRKAVLEVLRHQEGPVTIKEITEIIPNGKCDRATVYRAMQALESAEMVTRMEFGDGVARYELSCGEHTHHHHHLVCVSCNSIAPVKECIAEDLESKIAAQSGFRQITHKLEFFGVCPDCADEDGRG